MAATQQRLPFMAIAMESVRADLRRREIGQTVVVDGMNAHRERYARSIHECPSLYRDRRVKVTGHIDRNGVTLITVEGLPLLLAPGEYH